MEIPLVVCGEELRQMTPKDLLILNGIESPFVCGGEADALDVVIFLWFLNIKNDRTESWLNRRRKKQMMKRVALLPFFEAVQSCRDFVEGTFQDTPNRESGGGQKRPIGTALIVPLIVRIAKETGWDKDKIMQMPLAQLFQFLKHIRADVMGSDFCDVSPSDAITNEFLVELNTR